MCDSLGPWAGGWSPDGGGHLRGGGGGQGFALIFILAGGEGFPLDPPPAQASPWGGGGLVLLSPLDL